jgi:N-acyl-D-amino-acid deacylase
VSAPFETVLSGGAVVDGTGASPFGADVAITGDTIVAVGDLRNAQARERVDVAGLVVSPGFIDVHTHSDLAPLLDDRHEELKLATLRQGVTTEICGNCGFSVFPAPSERRDDLQRHTRSIFGPEAKVYAGLEDYRAAVGRGGLVTNLATLVGHGTLRAGVVGFANRTAEPAELRAMRAAAAAALDDGAVGLSSGLVYAPGVFAPADELVELARAAAERGRPYVSHIRNEADDVDEAIAEALLIGAESGARVQISHHKTAGRRNWGRTVETLEQIAEARERGVDVTLDVYPYTAGSTILASLLPPWANEGGMDALLGRLGSAEQRERIRRDLSRGLERWQRLVENEEGWENVRIASAPRHRAYEGMTIAALAQAERVDPVDLVADLLRAEDGQTTVVVALMAEQDVERVLASPLAMLGSDGIPLPGKPHPRWAGTFVRVLGHYVRERGLMTLESAVHKMTGLSAERFGLDRRGRIAEGMTADLVVFDPATVRDAATYDEPLLAPLGIHHVLVNGEFGVRDGAPTGRKAGAFLTR